MVRQSGVNHNFINKQTIKNMSTIKLYINSTKETVEKLKSGETDKVKLTMLDSVMSGLSLIDTLLIELKDIENSGEVLQEIQHEFLRAKYIFPRPFASGHEGYAVIREEMDELWDEIKAKDVNLAAQRQEAVQVAAMVVRFIVELIPIVQDEEV